VDFEALILDMTLSRSATLKDMHTGNADRLWCGGSQGFPIPKSVDDLLAERLNLMSNAFVGLGENRFKGIPAKNLQ
jgi:hypothetical protein